MLTRSEFDLAENQQVVSKLFLLKTEQIDMLKQQ